MHVRNVLKDRFFFSSSNKEHKAHISMIECFFILIRISVYYEFYRSSIACSFKVLGRKERNVARVRSRELIWTAKSMNGVTLGSISTKRISAGIILAAAAAIGYVNEAQLYSNGLFLVPFITIHAMLLEQFL